MTEPKTDKKQKNNAEVLKEAFEEIDPDLLFVDDFEKAILGVAERCSSPPVVVYDRTKCIEILMERGATYEEALEYFEFNVAGAWHGDRTPFFLTPMTEFDS